MKQHLFTYGSLMFENVWRRVVSGRYRSTPATLHGYRRQRVRGEDYPALEALPQDEAGRAGSGSLTHATGGHTGGGADREAGGGAPGGLLGRLYLAVAASDLAAVDTFEGEDYRRITVTVVTNAGRALQAATYLFLAGGKIEAKPWDPVMFEREHMARFMLAYPPPRPEGR